MANRIHSSDAIKNLKTYKFSDLVESCVTLQGKPFRFHSPAVPDAGIPEQRRDYLMPLYNNYYPELLLIFGRQCEKSTLLANQMTISCLIYPYHHWLYLNASLQQVGDFSKDKMDAAILQSPILRTKLYDPRSFNIFDKRFRNGSTVKLRGLFNGPDRVRGITCDSIAVDEIQDILTDDMYVAFEAQSHSEHQERRRIFCGTPKTETNTIEKFRLRSKQHELIFKCKHCSYSQTIEVENVEKKGLICRKCKRLLEDSPYKWAITSNPDTNLFSFRVPQVVVPWVRFNKDRWKSEIVHKLENLPLYMFANEVMARSWGNAERPVTIAMLQSCCTGGDFSPIEQMPNLIFGIDYGRGEKSLTVLTCVQFIHNRPRLVFAKKYRGKEADPLFYIEEIIRLKHSMGAMAIGADAGDGFMQNSTLKHRLGPETVWVFQATGNLHEESKWHDETKSFSFSRTKQLDKRFSEIRMGYVVFPKWEIARDLVIDFTNIYAEEGSHGKIIYNHDPDQPDDFAHAWNNALMAAEHMGIYSSPIREVKPSLALPS